MILKERLGRSKSILRRNRYKAGVLKSSFVAEVKSDLMGEQTILCGLLQTGSIYLSTKW
jgi:hypothetical protein